MSAASTVAQNDINSVLRIGSNFNSRRAALRAPRLSSLRQDLKALKCP